jgi:DnaK suppressor protein
MSEVNTVRFRTLLKGKYNELSFAPCDRDAIVIERTPDEIDRLERQLASHIAVFTLDQRANLLKNVQSALQRLDAEIYGVCLQCEEPIPEKRLNAMPWAPYCVSCQEEMDARPFTHEDNE